MSLAIANKAFIFGILIFSYIGCQAEAHEYNWTVKEASYTRLCETKNILTVNGEYPGPTLRVQRGDTIYVTVHNQGKYNITIHWHGVKQPRYPWSDGPEYITQCPIQPGGSFKQKIIFSSEEGTVWWHAHSDWSRATVHGAIFVYPKQGTTYPFPEPHAQIPIILGEWWKEDLKKVVDEFVLNGGDPNVSDAFTINGQPGDLYPCSESDTFNLVVDEGKTYLLRIINAAMNNNLFLAITNHNLTVVGTDGSYTKPLTTQYVVVSSGQTLDVLLQANQKPDQYYIAARAYSTGTIPFDNTTTTALLNYTNATPRNNSTPQLPYLPNYNDTNASFQFLTSLRSLGNPIDVPKNITTQIISTVSINSFPCTPTNGTLCDGPNGTRLAGSMNNISFQTPTIDILQAYYKDIKGVFGSSFPNLPPLNFNFTAEILPLDLQVPKKETEVKIIDFNATVEVVFQGTSLVSGTDHPMHLHGYSFYVVGFGFGNFDNVNDPLKYNLVDPPLQNTVTVPVNGWVAIRFIADNPGVWLLHCHIERHVTWGMETVFIVKNGKGRRSHLLPPPRDMPSC
ncbi:hypothetical protein ACFE04_007132 [Oxalis oulophora]